MKRRSFLLTAATALVPLSRAHAPKRVPGTITLRGNASRSVEWLVTEWRRGPDGSFSTSHVGTILMRNPASGEELRA
ncbi:MAG TPA: hypothetical protein VL494_13880 [Steroidobacteraceae bacterium]|jgi:hypothetical protein|nr:hypothetical protein [Steroidobacteraceae bacterium]